MSDRDRAPRALAAGLLTAGAIALVVIAPNDPPDAAPAAILVDLNSAPAHELRLLPGVGPALAERIVADRDENGPFATVDDLIRVRGLGERTVRELHPFATAGP